MDAKAIKSLFEHGVMPEGTESNDYPSEKEAKTFEEAKRALEEKTLKTSGRKRDFEEAKHELNEENKAEHDSDSQQSEDNHSDDQYK